MAENQLPKDSESLSTDRKGMGIVHNAFASTGDWEFRQITGKDVGTDCSLELIENEKYLGFAFNVQVKSTKKLKSYKNKKTSDLSIHVNVSTVNYWLNNSNPFLLLVVDTESSNVYWLLVQDYLSENAPILEKLDSDQKTITLRVPLKNSFSETNGT